MPDDEMPDITLRSDESDRQSPALPDDNYDLPECLEPFVDFTIQVQSSMHSLLSADTPRDQLDRLMTNACGKMTEIVEHHISLFDEHCLRLETIDKETAANAAEREQLDSEQDNLRTAQEKASIFAFLSISISIAATGYVVDTPQLVGDQRKLAEDQANLLAERQRFIKERDATQQKLSDDQNNLTIDRQQLTKDRNDAQEKLSDDQNDLTVARQRLIKDRDDFTQRVNKGEKDLQTTFERLQGQLKTLRDERGQLDKKKDDWAQEVTKKEASYDRREQGLQSQIDRHQGVLNDREDRVNNDAARLARKEQDLNEAETQAQNVQIAASTERRLIRGFFGLSEDSDDLIEHMTALKVRSTTAEDKREELTGLRTKVKSLEDELRRLNSAPIAPIAPTAPTAPTARSTFQNTFPTPGIMLSTETGHKRRKLGEDDSSSGSTLFTSSSNSSFDISARPANPFGSGIDLRNDTPFQRPEIRSARETPTHPRRQPTTSATPVQTPLRRPARQTPVRDTPLRKPADDIVTKTTAQVLALLEIDSRPASEASIELQNALEPHLRFYQTEAGFKSLKSGVTGDDYKCAAARLARNPDVVDADGACAYCTSHKYLHIVVNGQKDTISRTTMPLHADEQQGYNASDIRHYVSG